MITKNAPMGWNSWDCYGAAVTEDIVRKNAEFIAKHLKQYGWEYVVVDIQWYEPNAKTHDYNPFTELCMDEYSRLIPAENRFPSSKNGKGFLPLAEYVHSLGLKFGIHIMRGIPRQAVTRNTKILGTDKCAREVSKTASICMWNTDMYGVDSEKEGAREYYDSIFKLYASWGVDFVKCDDIAREFPHAEAELCMLSESLHSCGKDMILSLSPGPAPLEKAELFKQISNMWRITDDFWDNWQSLYNMFERCEKWAVHNFAGHWADADMLPLGAIRQDYGKDNRTNFTEDEQKTMMTLWSIFRSPLFMGGDLQSCDDFTFSLLTNSAILDMHKNSRFAKQLFRRAENGIEKVVWFAQRKDGGYYVALFNLSDEQTEISVSLDECEIETPVVSINDLWSDKVYDNVQKIKATVSPHGAAAFRID